MKSIFTILIFFTSFFAFAQTNHVEHGDYVDIPCSGSKKEGVVVIQSQKELDSLFTNVCKLSEDKKKELPAVDFKKSSVIGVSFQYSDCNENIKEAVKIYREADVNTYKIIVSYNEEEECDKPVYIKTSWYIVNKLKKGYNIQFKSEKR